MFLRVGIYVAIINYNYIHLFSGIYKEKPALNSSFIQKKEDRNKNAIKD